jgi:hypothetical protein
VSVVPCSLNTDLQRLIHDYAETLRTEAHRLGTHGLSENDFYRSGVFRGAIEQIRGEFCATMREKRDFAKHVLNYMQDRSCVGEWESSGEENRHDYTVRLPSGKVASIELKGCLDGNNTNIFERPPHAQEFIIWSICANRGADPRHNAWSGIHTRLSAEIITRQQRVDGLIIWDMICGTLGRPCPKQGSSPERVTHLAQYELPPPCIYVMPATIGSPRNNPHAVAQALADVQILQAFHDCFGGRDEEVNFVDFDVENRGADTTRRTRIRRGGSVVRESKPTAIRRA